MPAIPCKSELQKSRRLDTRAVESNLAPSRSKTYPGADMNSDHNPVVVKINMKLKRTNATKRSEQLELNLLKEETYKTKYNVEVQNIYERLCIEETEQQPDNGSFNNLCDQKWTTVKQSIKSSLNAVLPRKANRKKAEMDDR